MNLQTLFYFTCSKTSWTLLENLCTRLNLAMFDHTPPTMLNIRPNLSIFRLAQD